MDNLPPLRQGGAFLLKKGVLLLPVVILTAIRMPGANDFMSDFWDKPSDPRTSQWEVCANVLVEPRKS